MGMNDRGVPTSRTLLNRTWTVLIANAALIVAVMVVEYPPGTRFHYRGRSSWLGFKEDSVDIESNQPPRHHKSGHCGRAEHVMTLRRTFIHPTV